MIQHLISEMCKIVADRMTSFQSDFEKYDRELIESGELSFPFIWIVGETHTKIIGLADYEASFNECERERYDYCYEYPYFWAIDHLYKRDGYFLINEFATITPITSQQAKNIIKDFVVPVAVKWQAENGKLPKKPKVNVNLQNITISQLKELFRECERHGDKSLQNIFRGFHNYRKISSDQNIVVSYDESDRSFWFEEYYNGESHLCGAIKFHGWPETGYLINGSYQVNPSYGWASHT